MGVFGPIVQMPTHFPTFLVAKLGHCCAVGSKTIGDERLRLAVPTHRLLEKDQCSELVPRLRHEARAFMIDRGPQVIRLAVDLHDHFVDVPAPLNI